MLYPSLPPVLKTFAARAGIPDSAVTASFIMANGKPLVALQLLNEYKKNQLTAYTEWIASVAREKAAQLELLKRNRVPAKPDKKADVIRRAEQELLSL